MIIFDELTYAKQLLVKGFKKYVNTNDLTILTQYFRQNGITDELELEKNIIAVCKKHDSEFNEVLHAKKIDSAIRRSRNRILRIPVEIPITENELKTIRNLKNYRYEKILFTMLVIGKYLKLTKPGKNKDSEKYFVNMEQNSIFELARTAQKRGENILYELGQLNLIDMNLKFGSYLILFTDINDKSDVKIVVTDVNRIIDFYSATCESCGIEINRNLKHNKKYCKNCWNKIKNY